MHIVVWLYVSGLPPPPKDFILISLLPPVRQRRCMIRETWLLGEGILDNRAMIIRGCLRLIPVHATWLLWRPAQ